MVPVKKLILVMAFVVSFSFLPIAAIHAERSPVFGSATVQALSLDASRDITARGAWADYFGNLAISNAYSAYIYSFYARYYGGSNTATEKAWYDAASLHAYHAYIYSLYASAYSAAGI